MTAIGQVVDVGGIESIAVKTLVQRPVERQIRLDAAQHAVVVTGFLLVGQSFVPYANLGDVALEGISGLHVVSTTNGEGNQTVIFLGGQLLSLAIVHLDQKVATRLAQRQ